MYNSTASSCQFHTPSRGRIDCPYYKNCPFASRSRSRLPSRASPALVKSITNDIMSLPFSDVSAISKSMGIGDKLCKGDKCKEIAYVVILENGNGKTSTKLKKILR